MSRNKAEQPKRLAEKLKQIRLSLGLTQEAMFQALEKEKKPNVTLHFGYLTRFESGTRVPPLLIILAYSKVAKIGMEYLVDDELDLPE